MFHNLKYQVVVRGKDSIHGQINIDGIKQPYSYKVNIRYKFAIIFQISFYQVQHSLRIFSYLAPKILNYQSRQWKQLIAARFTAQASSLSNFWQQQLMNWLTVSVFVWIWVKRGLLSMFAKYQKDLYLRVYGYTSMWPHVFFFGSFYAAKRKTFSSIQFASLKEGREKRKGWSCFPWKCIHSHCHTDQIVD